MVYLFFEDSDETIPPRIPQETEHRKEDSNKSANRLSVISCDSVKNSSESVEVLTGTGCTTTPDSDSSMAQLTSNTSKSLEFNQLFNSHHCLRMQKKVSHNKPISF